MSFTRAISTVAHISTGDGVGLIGKQSSLRSQTDYFGYNRFHEGIVDSY